MSILAGRIFALQIFLFSVCLLFPLTMMTSVQAQEAGAPGADGNGVDGKGAGDQPPISPPGQGPSKLQPDPDRPIAPGGVRITLHNPDAGKWNVAPAQPTTVPGINRTFNCKPLACADSARVTITTSRSPTRNPDPQALEKLAKVDLPKAVRAQNAAQDVLSDGANKIETLTSKTTRMKNYPAVVNETKFSAGKRTIFTDTAMVFAGPTMLKIISLSPNREVAQKSLDEFVASVDIKEGPPPQSSSTPKPSDAVPKEQRLQSL
jgi:hypothetical protein